MPNIYKNMKIGFISTSNYTLKYFLREYIEALAKDNEVTLISNLEHGVPSTDTNIKFIEIPFRRTPHPWSDSINLIRLCSVIRKNKFDVVYTISPKGGFLGMLASTLMNVKKRIHFFTGQVWITKKGIWKFLLKNMDKAIGFMSTYSLVDSPSQRSFLIQNKVVKEKKSTVLGSGSVSGVDSERFKPSLLARQEVRSALGIPESMVLLLFLGRLTRDKGVHDLLSAFKQLAEQQKNIGLLYVGADEGMLDDMQKEIKNSNLDDIVWFHDSTPTPEKFLAASDIFCLPSYREGFGLVVLEAASTGLPAIGSNIYGISDAISDGKTGALHKAGDATDIARALLILIENKETRESMGKEAMRRAHSHFSKRVLLQAFLDFHAEQTQTLK